MRAGIANYRMGNLASVAKALERVGADSFISALPAELEESDLVVLPGVGNFAAGMANLRAAGLDSFVKDWAAASRPLLGICMGMQMFFDHSEEGDTPGLGILPGRVARLTGDRDGDLKVPHMGWNTLGTATGLFRTFESRHFYFVHSYACVPAGDVAAWTTYGAPFASAVMAGRVVGVQFHPEKSSHDGLELLERTLDAVGSLD
ncbi:MAG: imidazole glycerol phosphate synthase subunit HisH [Actinomycetota bacterium]